jgi:excisionase family DNA binding protein
LSISIGICIAHGKRQGVYFMDRNFDQIRLLTLAEAARLLQVSTRTLQRMIHSNNLPALKVGGQWRVRESQLTEWIQRREGRHTPNGQIPMD